MKYTTGLPVGKFADLLARLREEGVEGYPPSGAAGVFDLSCTVFSALLGCPGR